MIRGVRNRPGFSLIELLAIVAIIGLLIGLLLPAVSRVREAAKRTNCMSNLKQVALSVHNYAATYDKLPPLYRTSTEEGVVKCGLMFQLLPYLEQDALYKEWCDNGKGNGWNDKNPNDTPLKLYQCPDDLTINQGLTTSGATPGWGACSYGANYLLFGSMPGEKEEKGSYLPKYTIDNIPDGVSSTIMFVERSASYSETKDFKAWQCAWAYPPCDDAKGLPPKGWENSAVYAVPNRLVQPPQFGITPAEADPMRPQSFHRQVCCVGICDGSVRVISAKVGQQTWQWAVDPADGNVLGEDWN